MKFYIFLFTSLLFNITNTFSFYEYPFNNITSKLMQIETPNFRIIFSESSRSNAYEIATFIEDEFHSLTNYYGEFLLPKYSANQKIRVIVSSDYQIANGFASLFLFPTMHLYTKIPPNLSSSHSYTEPDHLRTLVRHELAHIITLAIRKYFPKHPVINFINKAVVPVAVFSSRSFLEGAAIARESDSHYGRLNDPYTYHLMRRTLLDNKFPTFAQFGGANTAYEKGSYPYTYGALFNKYLSKTISSNSDRMFWENTGEWKITSWALKNVAKKTQKELWQGFTNFLLSELEYQQPNKKLLSLHKKQRLNSIQYINDKIYYFNIVNKELRAYDLAKKKDFHVLYGKRTWQKVSISSDEKTLLISGFTEKKIFTVVLDKNSLLPKTKVFVGIDDGSFLPDYRPDNIVFVAVNRNSTYPQLVIYSNNQLTNVYQGSSINYFDSPIAIDTRFIYLLHSYNGERYVSRFDRQNSTMSSLKNNNLSFPRFLTADNDSISVSYASDVDSFYKRAIIKNNTLQLIQNNIKGEIFDSIVSKDTLYYRSSFSEQDNLLEVPLNDLNIQTRNSTFVPLQPLPNNQYLMEYPISQYKISQDFPTFSIFPFVSLEKVGIGFIVLDSIGANVLDIGVNIEYEKGTPEFNFQWHNKEFPVNILVNIYNLYNTRYSILQLSENHLVNVGFGVLYDFTFPNAGNINIFSGLNWRGYFTGDTTKHPYQWSNLEIQQLLNVNQFSWSYFVSEGEFGFYRRFSLGFQYRVDLLNPKWYRVEGNLSFSPPIVPVRFNFTTLYDTASFSVFGLSVLGNSSIPIYREFSKYNIFSQLVLYGDIDLMLYSWEIQNGLGFGEIFFNRWAFFTGYRAGYWGEHNPFLHSVYLKTRFDFSLIFGNLPISFEFEGYYAITTGTWGYNYLFSFSINL